MLQPNILCGEFIKLKVKTFREIQFVEQQVSVYSGFCDWYKNHESTEKGEQLLHGPQYLVFHCMF